MPTSRPERVLVTGASGSIGNAMCRRLLDEGVVVRGLTRDPSRLRGLAEKGAEVAKADLTDVRSLRRAAEGCDTVLHLAGAVGVPDPWPVYEAVNVGGTRNLIRVCAEHGVTRFVHASTAWVYGLDAGPRTDEQHPYRFSNDPYCDTKIRGEQVVREAVSRWGFPAVVVQPGPVYGPAMTHWTVRPLELVRRGFLVLPDGGRGLLHPVFIDDLVDGMVASLEWGRLGARYLLSGPEAVLTGVFFGGYVRMLGGETLRSLPGSVAEWGVAAGERVARAVGVNPPLRRADVRALRLRASYELSRARRELGFIPRTGVVEGMEKVARWVSFDGHTRE